MSFFGKVFKFHSSENYDDFMNSLGLPSETLRFLNFKADQKIEKSGDNYIYTINTPKGDKLFPFTSGVEIHDKGLSVKNTFTVNENVVTHIMKFDNGLVVTSKKEFTPTKMVEEVTNSNWDGAAHVTYSA